MYVCISLLLIQSIKSLIVVNWSVNLCFRSLDAFVIPFISSHEQLSLEIRELSLPKAF